jgi:hypothetical protein
MKPNLLDSNAGVALAIDCHEHGLDLVLLAS